MNHSYVQPSKSGLLSRLWSDEKKYNNALLDAAANGQTLRFQKLLLRNLDLDYTDKNGMAALHLAVQNGHTGIARLLLEAGADPGRQLSQSCSTPLIVAARSNRPKMIELLLDNGAPLHTLMEASIPHPVDYAELYLFCDALGFAIYDGQTSAVKLLLRRGANAHGVCCTTRPGMIFQGRPKSSYSFLELLFECRWGRKDDHVPIIDTLISHCLKLPRINAYRQYSQAIRGHSELCG